MAIHHRLNFLWAFGIILVKNVISFSLDFKQLGDNGKEFSTNFSFHDCNHRNVFYRNRSFCWCKSGTQLNIATDLEFCTESIQNFWSTVRNEDEIVSFISKALLRDKDNNDENSEDGDSQAVKVHVFSADPPLILIENFISNKMCDEIIDAAIVEGNLMRSTLGAEKIVDSQRTSSNTWLEERDCERPLRTLAENVSRISCLPPNHMENLQVVKYLPGEQFSVHTDHLDSFNDLECRGRLATCLIYLNSATSTINKNINSSSDSLNQELPVSSSSSIGSFRGGSTTFPEYDLSVSPKKGSAVFFWNTKERPGSDGYHSLMDLTTDERLRHSGDPVLEGEKWACNRWIHPIPYGEGLVRGL